MPEYLALVRPSVNRIYGRAAGSVISAEATTLGRSVGEDLGVMSLKYLAGPEWLSFSTSSELGPAAISRLAGSSSLLGVFRKTADDALIPVSVAREECVPDSIMSIQRYKGKTNETFTRLMVTLGLACLDDSPTTVPRILDPVAGRGTTLNVGAYIGCDVSGIEMDKSDFEQYRTFIVRWLKDNRFRFAEEQFQVPGRDRSLNRGFAVRYSPNKAAERSGHFRHIRFVNGDTADASAFFKSRGHDLVIADLPYGVQHRSAAGRSSTDLSPLSMLVAAMPSWLWCLKRTGAIVLAFNTLTLSRSDLIDFASDCGLVEHPLTVGLGFAHQVDASISRDLVILRHSSVHAADLSPAAEPD